jgi:hypothetical protein
MRNYEFRGRRLGEKDFVYGSLKQTGGICEIVTFDKEAYEKEADKNGWDIFDYTNEVTVDAETVGQYTESTDKNGNKIWEGDVDSDENHIHWCNKKNGWALAYVDFDNEVVCHCYNCSGNFELYETIDTMEIIGNIFEKML